MAKIVKEEKEKKDIDVFASGLVPRHDILTLEERERVLTELNITPKQMPRIKQTDPVVKQLGAKKGDIVRIKRNDPGIGDYYYYRVVVS